MFKIINLYITKLFIYRFIITFFIIFFLFIIEFFWSKLENIIEKGVYIHNIIKLLFYFGILIVPLIIPLSILLTSVMIYGEFSEKNEILAIKAIGLSIYKILKPTISIVLLLSLLVYLFSEYMIPICQNKIKNIVYSIETSDSFININTAIFIQKIPSFILKVDKKINGYNNYFKGIYIKWYLNNKNIQRTIIADKGFIDVSSDTKYVTLNLFNGIIYEEYNEYYNKNINIIKFYKLLQKFKKPYKKLINNYNDKSDFIMLNRNNLVKKIKILKKQISIIKNNLNYNTNFFLKQKKYIKEKILHNYQLELNNRFSFPFTCIIMFFIGSYLGILTKRGGIGIPVIVSLIVFVIYYIILTFGKIFVNINLINPILGSWLANIILFPLMIYTIHRYNSNLI